MFVLITLLGMSTYRSATNHYLSPRRRDSVKVMLEELVTHEMFADAVGSLGLEPGARLRVLDVGSGTGDGLALLTEAHGELPPVTAGYALEYRGLDSDAAMVETARGLRTAPGVAFEVGDVRDWRGDEPFDLYLSCGVPYSHLTGDELAAALTALLRGIARGGRRAALLVDVLGRYSMEWAPRWSQTAWDYAMSFFEDTAEHLEQPMTFYDRPALGAAIAAAADAAGVRPEAVTYTDRSVLVGRHTATRTFNPDIPAYRTLVNDLVRAAAPVRPRDLRFTPPETGAPADILEFFATWARDWNALVDAAGDPDTPLPADRGAELATALLRHERHRQAGLGAGHSLTATVIVDPR